MQQIPNTESYYHVAYAVVITLYALYSASIWLRARSLRSRANAARSERRS